MTTADRASSDTVRALEEIAAAVTSVPETELDAVVDELLAARRIACYAGGREGLVLRGLVMRLFHAGLDVHYVGEMTCPAVGPGDLVVLSCGPGRISMVEALAGVALRDGARLLYLTAQPQNPPADRAHRVVQVKAQTMADDTGSRGTPTERPKNLTATPDKIAAAVLLKQSLEKLGHTVPPWVGDLAASRPHEDEARRQDGRSPTHVVVEGVEVAQDQHGRQVYLLSSEEAQRVARRVQATDDTTDDGATPNDDGGR
jgi:6-phospho-3-hexuloisomerase